MQSAIQATKLRIYFCSTVGRLDYVVLRLFQLLLYCSSCALVVKYFASQTLFLTAIRHTYAYFATKYQSLHYFRALYPFVLDDLKLTPLLCIVDYAQTMNFKDTRIYHAGHRIILKAVNLTLQRGSITVNTERCKGCELCVVACPAQTLELAKSLNHKGYRFSQQVREQDCIGCACCAKVCPDGCITVHREGILADVKRKFNIV